MSQPKRGGGGFNLDDYVDVAARIDELYKRFTEGSLTTEWPPLVFEVGNQTFVSVKAYAHRTPDDPVPGVGVAWEPVPGATPYTRNSELMNAQTAAWGRAIVAVGIPTKHIATANDVRNRRAEQGEEPQGQRSEDRNSPRSNLRDRMGVPPADVDTETGEIRDNTDYSVAFRQAMQDAAITSKEVKVFLGIEPDGQLTRGHINELVTKHGGDARGAVNSVITFHQSLGSGIRE